MYMTGSDEVDATATNTDAIAIGNGAAATTYGTIAIGANTGDNMSGSYTVAIGSTAGSSAADADELIAIGWQAGYT